MAKKFVPAGKRGASRVVGQDQGRLVVDSTGAKRIVLSDVHLGSKEGEPERLSLYQILKGDIVITGNDDREIRLKPLSLNGYATLEEMYAAEGGLDFLSKRSATIRDYVRIATVMANQDAPEDQQLTERDVGNILTMENYQPFVRLIVAVLAGPTKGVAATAPVTPTNAPTGPLSSTSVPSGSGGPPSRSDA